jgi:hypothetical protein
MRSKGLVSSMQGALLITALGWGASLLWAQSATTGGLTGTVTDQTGAVVPGVTATLINDATGQTQATMTDTKGLYGFSLLAPGSYAVNFYTQGFKTSEATSVVVNVSEVTVLNAKLEPGEPAQRVACQCIMGKAAASASGTLVNSKTITSVPLTTRNFTQLLSMSSGSAAAVNNAGLLGSISQVVNVNGNTTTGIYTLDGAVFGNTVPNPDTISEFKIQNSQYDGSYGARVPSTNLVTRSGEKDFHGDLWEFVRNNIFNANDFFRNAAGQPRPDLKQNQFGGTIGGPIKRDKLFFFASYQGTRQVNGLDPTSESTALLPPLTNDRSAATIGSEFCPANKPASVAPRYLTYAGGVQVACDGSNINPVALKILQRKLPDGSYAMPTPQTVLASGPNAGLGFSSYSLPSTYQEDHFLGNIDYVISKKHTLSGRTYFSTNESFRSLGSGNFTSSMIPVLPGFPQKQQGPDDIASLRLVSVPTRNVVNEAIMTFTRSNSIATGPGDRPVSSVGMISVDPLHPVLPEIDVTGSLGAFQLGNAQNESTSLSKTYTWADTISLVHGRHSMRFGGFVLKQRYVLYDTGVAPGRMFLQNFSDFLLGMSAAQNGSPQGLSNIQNIDAREGLGPNGEILFPNRTFYGSAFVEDDIKVNSRFTLNLGLRWEYFPASLDPTGENGNAWPSLLKRVPVPPASGTYVGTTVAANYNPNTFNPYTGQPFGPPPAGVFVRPNPSYYQNFAPLDNFSPRFGFAWQPGKKGRLDVHGGYGWFYQPPADRGSAPNLLVMNMAPFAQLFENAGASNSASTLQQPFPTPTLGFSLRTPTSQLTDRIIGPEFKIPLLQQWNLGAQYNFTPTFSFDLDYVGSYGSNLLLSYGANQPVLASPGNPVNCGLPVTPLFTSLGVNAAGCVTTNTSANAFLRAPVVGETPTALSASQNIGQSWYHSMQATFKKQFSQGLMFQIAYTYSKDLTNTTVDNNQDSLATDWARASFDRTHRLISNFFYGLPSLRAKGFTGEILNGWSVSGIVIIQSGLPMTLTDINGSSVYGFAGFSTITLCPGATPASLVTSGRVESRLNHWINTSGICPASVIGSDGSTGYGNTALSIINGPGQFNTDLSIGKTTTVGGIRENAQLALRIEFYNAINHPQFSNPGTMFGTANFGVLTQSAVAPRLIQFGLKYLF